MGSLLQMQVRAVAADMERIFGAAPPPGTDAEAAGPARARSRALVIVPERRSPRRGLRLPIALAAAAAVTAGVVGVVVWHEDPVRPVPAQTHSIAVPLAPSTPAAAEPMASRTPAADRRSPPTAMAAIASAPKPHVSEATVEKKAADAASAVPSGRGERTVAKRDDEERRTERTAAKRDGDDRRTERTAAKRDDGDRRASRSDAAAAVRIASARRGIDAGDLSPLPQPSCRSGRDSDACLYEDVRAADRRLLAAYIEAAHAGVPRRELSDIKRSWSSARSIATSAPDEMIRRYRALTRMLHDAASRVRDDG